MKLDLDPPRNGVARAPVGYPLAMPLLEITTSNDLFENVREKILREASHLVARQLGKSEDSVMVTLRHAHSLFCGESVACAFLELRSAGALDAQTATRISGELCKLMEKEADVPPQQVYLNFLNVPRGSWGRNGKLIG